MALLLKPKRQKALGIVLVSAGQGAKEGLYNHGAALLRATVAAGLSHALLPGLDWGRNAKSLRT